MKSSDFSEFYKGIVDDALGVQAKATQEYASDESKFDNFEGIAEFMRKFNPRMKDVTAEDIAWIYRLKHIVSRIKDVSLREDMRGRAIDDMNYGILIEGMRQERIEAAAMQSTQKAAKAIMTQPQLPLSARERMEDRPF